MSNTIEQLELEITANSKSAVNGIDALTQSLMNLKSATKGGLGLTSVAKETGKLNKAIDKLSANKKGANSVTDFFHAIKIGANTILSAAKTIGSAVDESTEYIENVNLFTVSMGEYANEAMEYAETVSDAMGIDTSEWIRAQGIFMTLSTGFGVASDRANTMSKNLTQLGYDLSSFFNISVEDAMQKLQSGLSGELEPLRRLGYDLSQAKLEATAAELGITKSVSAMTQAEKAQLRYYAIMTQVTTAQGDMARTLDDPANQLRVLKAQLEMAAREIGNVFIPALNAILPYAIAVVKVIRILASNIASLFGYKAPEIDTTTSKVVENTDAMQENLEGAKEEAKKLKSYMLGIDELNVINPNTDSGADTSGSEFEFELPEYDFMSDLVDSKVSEIVEDMKEWLGITDDINSWSDLFNTKLGDILKTVGLIGVGLLAWKLSSTFLNGLESLTTSLGLMLLIDSVLVTVQDGLNWKSLIEGAVGGALMGAGIGFKLGGWKGAIGGVVIGIGVSLLINGITSMVDEGIDLGNVLAVISGALGVVGGIVTVVKLFNKNTKNPVEDLDTAGDTIAEVGKGTSKLFDNLKSLAKNLALGIVIVAEVAVVAGIIIGAIWGIGLLLEQVGIAWQPVIDNGGTIAIAIGIGTALLVAIGVVTALLGTLGAQLIVNIALGAAILAELGVATILFIAEILVIGLLLDEVRVAWEPVIENGETIATAIGIGTAMLVAIGVVTALLGTLGAPLIVSVALGTVILAELGVATVLFIAEILVIGLLLDEVGKAWQPVIDNGETIATAIGLGTALLVGIGVVTAALGVATVATAGALPLAIGLGTAMLVLLSEAFVLFVDELVKVANQLANDLHPALDELNDILPDLSVNMENFTGFMQEFAGHVVSYTGSSAISGLASTINTIVGFFTDDPIEKMTKEVRKQKNQFDDLIKELEKTIPKIQRAIELTLEYNAKMDEYARVSGSSSGSNDSSSKGWLGSIVDGIGSLFKSVQPPSLSIPAYANGGFVNEGQLFLAREAGAEMVGNIGRRTAVANNDQIVSGIAGGVAEANEEQNALLREQNSLLRAIYEKESGVILDGKHLTNSVEKYQRERGRVLVTGGVM